MTPHTHEPGFERTVDQGVPAPPTNPPDDPKGGAGAGPASVVAELMRLRGRARALLLAQRVSLIVACIVGASVVLGLLDLMLRTPGWLRGLLWLCGIAAIVWAFVRLVRPALRFNPTLTDVALRVERIRPELKGRLASAVDFSDELGRAGGTGTDAIRGALAQQVVREVASSWRSGGALPALAPEHAGRRGGLLLASLAFALLLLILSPGMWLIGAQRVWLPWSDAQWPRRTIIADATGAEVHPLGSAMPLRVALVRSSANPDAATVAVRYRSIVGSDPGPVRRELLTWQGRSVEASLPDGSGRASGELFERLIDPMGDAIEYMFESDDDATEWRRIKLVDPPVVVRASAVITLPEYARAGADESELLAGQDQIDLGPGTDDRAVAPSVLAGSRVELEIDLNKPVEMPESVRGLFADVEGAAMYGEDIDAASEAIVRTEGKRWSITWTLTESLRIPVTLTDEYGITSIDEAVFRFDATHDKPAGATITEPSSDQSVLATASVGAVGEGRDDVGLAWVSIEREMWRIAGAGDHGREPSGPGGALERIGEPVEVVRADARRERLRTVGATIRLSPLGLRPGDELHLFAIAQDGYAFNGEAHDPTRSAPRVLRIISEKEFVDELRTMLNDVRQAAIRVESQQRELRQRTSEQGADQQSTRGQAQIGERLARQQEAVERMRERVERNALEDPALNDILAGAESALERAARESGQASQEMERAVQSQRGPSDESVEQSGELDPEQAEAVRTAQERVEQELADLIRMLDRGEDSWVVQNTIERMLREQRELRESSRNAAAETAGRDPGDLAPDQRSEMERIAEQQQRLAQQAEELMREMREREESLRDVDPSTAAGMAQAAARAEQEQVPQTMQQASQSASQNQMTQAGEQQDEAIEALEQMLEDLAAGERAREEILQRILANLIESLEALIKQQETEIRALDEAQREERGAQGLDRAMISLNQNTISVADLARQGGSEVIPVANLIDRAAEAQGLAIVGLRAATIDYGVIRGHEERSLDFLKRAKERSEEIERQSRQREREKKLAELRRWYREALEQQVALRSEAREFAALEALSRRDRVLVRQLGARQEELRLQIASMVEKTAELSEAKVFEYAHRQIDAAARSAGEALNSAEPARALPHADRAVLLLQRVLDALADPPPDEEQFSEPGSSGESGGGGSGGDQPLLPPLKELRLLREMQMIVALQTREFSEAGARPSAEDLRDLARVQRDLSEVGEDLIRRMSRQPTIPMEPPVREEGGDAALEGDDEDAIERTQPVPPGEESAG